MTFAEQDFADHQKQEADLIELADSIPESKKMPVVADTTAVWWMIMGVEKSRLSQMEVDFVADTEEGAWEKFLNYWKNLGAWGATKESSQKQGVRAVKIKVEVME